VSRKRKSPYETAKRQKELERKKKKELKKQNKLKDKESKIIPENDKESSE
jgi:hypothetical protein